MKRDWFKYGDYVKVLVETDLYGAKIDTSIKHRVIDTTDEVYGLDVGVPGYERYVRPTDVEAWSLHEKKEQAIKAKNTINTSVEKFSKVMVAKLIANKHKGHWAGCSMEYLFGRIREELDELESAVRIRLKSAEEVFEEAADVANFSMMIAEVFKAEADAIKWLHLLDEGEVNYGLSHDGISYHSDADLEKAREIAKEHGMEHMLEDDPIDLQSMNKCKCGMLIAKPAEICAECEEDDSVGA